MFADSSYPVQIQFGSGSPTEVSSGSGDGQYNYDSSGNTLTYLFPAGSQPTAGTTATLSFYTRVKASARDSYLDSNGNITFTNEASLTWSETTTITSPSDTASITNGVGSGGLLSKSSAGGTPNYEYSAGDPGTIHWTTTVNRNGISIVDAKVTDNIPPGQELLLDSSHPFTVTKKGTPDSEVENFSSPPSSGNLTSADSFKNDFSYEFPQESSGTDTISGTYTLDYYTRILDTVPGTAGDNSGLDTLYSNGNSSGIVTFKNGVTLTRSGSTVTGEGSKGYKSQILDKTVKTAYNYTERTLEWQIVVNRNKLPLTNAKVTDTLPTGMTLLIDAGHPFTVTTAGGGAPGTLTTGANGDTSFVYDLPSLTMDQYTITFWTLMNEDALKLQWNGTKNFTNNVSLEAAEISSPITKYAVAQIKNPVITKTYAYTPGSDYISWSAVINPGQMTLPNGVITDVLNSGLQLDPASLKLYTVPVDPITGEAAQSSAGTLVTGGYNVTQPTTGNSNTLAVSLPANTSSAYRLEFITNILVDNLDIANSITLSGSAGDTSGSADSTQIHIVNLFSSGGSGSNTLSVHKTDTDGNPLVNAKFRLLNVNKQPVTSGGNSIIRTTDASGNAVFNNLPSWVFYVEETEPPAGYFLPSNPIFGGNRLSGSETVSVSDTLALATVDFEKKGAGGALLSGGVFTLTGKNYLNNDVSLTATAVNGIVSFTGVPLGKTGEPYTITESVPPEGHSLNASTLSATVLYNADKTALTVTVTPNELVNTPLPGTVSFTKTGLGGVPLSGGTFTLTGTDYDGVPVNMTTSAVGGTVTFPLVPIGNYTIAETDPPAGYLQPGSPDILTASVEYNAAQNAVVSTLRRTSSGTPVVNEFANTPALGSISFSKISVSGAPLSNGIFMLTGTDYSGKPVAMTASSVAGIVTFNEVPLGNDYKIRETSPPAGYILSNTELTASVVYNADKTSVITSVTPDTLTNTPSSSVTVFGSIEITKTNEDGSKLAGAVFTLYSKTSGKIIATASSDAKGRAYFDNVPTGQYVIKETKPPEGYALNTESIDVSITGTTTRSFTVINQREEALPGSIEITKTDDQGNLLKDAEFTLYDAGGTALQVIVTDANGRALFEKLPPGVYKVSETRVPPGFSAATGSTEVSLSSGQTLKLTIKNQKIDAPIVPEVPTLPENSLTGSIRIKKITKDSTPLSGAEFTLFDTTDTVIVKAISDQDGLVNFEKLAPGEYTLRETAAPKGYALFSEPLAVSLKEEQVLSYTLRNNLLTDENPAVLGWYDDNTPSPGGILPKAGGISRTFLIGMFGFILLSAGLLLAKPKKYRRKLS
ncbi:SpaA isopeptide-forming pilin-related protein [Desulfosporosinus hippei]|uniref:SpaA isopeptide-forming pilin-related protein n=1 Tax=Desulfosporosinus hippei TaxID=569859 RepID=UPI00159FB601|nr:SpaA isopeptide-forming pilin-related protein [Desulfosporosinus hippei]